MISIVCVYNNEKMLNDVLLKGLEHQSVEFELITLDNRENRFKSAAQALNYGGKKAKGEYIMFTHQDMWFSDTLWLENSEKMLHSIPDLGVAGVAGASEEGRNWAERCRHSITFFDENWDIAPVKKYEKVQTLDECVLIVHQSVFNKVKFDEEVFDGWDSYGADYCLAIRKLGKKAYVIPGESRHCCLRENVYPWELKNLFKYQKRLYNKYRNDNIIIYTWMGKVTWWSIRFLDLLSLIGPLYLKLFPDKNILLAKELEGCNSVLDLGCGHKSPISSLNIPYSVGVELSDPYLQESKRLGTHSEYIAADIREIEFQNNSFDAVVALGVMEYLTKQEAIELIQKMERWASKKIMIQASNASIKNQTDRNYNATKNRKSTWKPEEFNNLGFTVHGLDGWMKLKQEKPSPWHRIASAFTQKITFHLSKKAASMLASKNTR